MLLFPSVCLHPPQYASLAFTSFYAHGYLYLYLYVHGHCHEQSVHRARVCHACTRAKVQVYDEYLQECH
jgi:hypothetical protein